MQNFRRLGAWHGEAAALALLLGVYLLLALAYGAATPHLEAPDAGAHFRYVAYLRQQPQLPPADLPTALISHQLVQQPPLYYALAAGVAGLLRPQADLQATVAYEQAVLTPYFEKGLGKRATVSPPGVDPEIVWPLRVARGVSLAGGLLTVAATYALARALLWGRRWPAPAIAAVVAYNPQFLFTSTAITNDVWAAALATVAVAAAAYAARAAARWPLWLLVGALCGLATLTKYSGVITLLPVALLAVALRPSAAGEQGGDPGKGIPAGLRELLVQGLAVGVGFLAVTGVQWAHNLASSGELLPMQSIRVLLPGLIRPQQLELRELWELLPFLTRSYTGIFGYGVRASTGYFEVVDAAIALALGGAAVLLVKWALPAYRAETRDLVRALAVAAAWFVALLGSLAAWIRIMIAGEQGRLLFPAAAAVATCLVLGWIGWLPRRWQPWAAGLIVVGMVGLGVWQYPTVQAVYATPPALAAGVAPPRVVNATFAPGMEVVGYDLPAGGAMEFGEELPITLYFRAASPVEADYTLFLHLVDGEDRMLYQFDGIPYAGRHPPRQWRAGEIFADQYTIRAQAPDEATAKAGTLASLSLGFYPVLQPLERAAVMGADGQPVGDRVQLGAIRVLPEGARAEIEASAGVAAGAEAGASAGTSAGTSAGAAAGAAVSAGAKARWAEGIVLQEAAVVAEEDGAPKTLRLRWRAEENGMRDYTVFVQALDADGNLLAQVDRQPQGGQMPTSTWLAGEQIDDQVTFTAPLDGWQQIIVGLYDAAGVRLPLVELEGQAAAADFAPLLYAAP